MKPAFLLPVLLLLALVCLTGCGKTEEPPPHIERIEDAQHACWRIRDVWHNSKWTCEKKQ